MSFATCKNEWFLPDLPLPEGRPWRSASSVVLDVFTTEPFEPPVLASELGIGPDSILGQAAGTLQIRI
jgi:hypothetical protein